MLSIIIPIYNSAIFLEKSLQTLEKQTLQDIEFILINDGSTDNSEEICKIFVNRDPRFRLISKSNEGYGITCNLGIIESKGDYIAIFEPDDEIIKDTSYSDLYKYAKLYMPDIIRANYTIKDTRSSSITKNKNFYKPFEDLIENNPIINKISSTLFLGISSKQQKCFNILKTFSQHPAIWAGCYKKIFLLENNIMFIPNPGASFQDSPFYIETMLQAKEILFWDQDIYEYKIHNTNSIYKNRGTFIHLDILENLLSRNILNHIPKKNQGEFFQAYLSQIVWIVNKTRNIQFALNYNKNISMLIKQNIWKFDPTLTGFWEKKWSYACKKTSSQFNQNFYFFAMLCSSVKYSEHLILKIFAMPIIYISYLILRGLFILKF